MIRTFGWLLGIDDLKSIDSFSVTLGSSSARNVSFWLFALIVGVVCLSVLFYLRRQQQGPRWLRMTLGIMRGVLMALLVITLADPVLQLQVVNRLKPLVYVVVDGTESMTIDDGPEGQTRIASSKSLLTNDREGLLARFTKENQADVELFLFDGNTTSQVRRLRSGQEARLDLAKLSEQLKATGKVTALGSVLSELEQQYRSRRLAGVVLLSDFAQNSGPPPLASGQSPASRLGVPLYTVGVGATEAMDLSIDLEIEPKMKKGERSTVVARVKQNGLGGQSAIVQVVAKELGGLPGAPPTETIVGERTVPLNAATQAVEFSFTPEQSGRFELVATAADVAGEKSVQNNQASRQVNIIDDYLRLMYVAYEPTWEWRFVKEVFHRDKLVGLDGFRTFLSSSDPRVRESNSLFLPTLTPKRSEFFATDVLFVDDMPRTALSDRFNDLTQEYVGQLGGGMVVIAGPRFGPRELLQTPLADMLPVIIDPNVEAHAAPDYPEFRPRLTPHAERYSFMQLGGDKAENLKAWSNLGKLPWYQPVARPHPQAEVLLEHPTDKCADGKTPQPLIAIRPYGKGGSGEVVWIGFNEMWRLRKQYGEKYYRQFWSQLIYRLGMSHALGFDKRFVVRLDQEQYRAEDKVHVSVEVYDQNYEPLTDDSLPERGLVAELVIPSAAEMQPQKFSVPMLRKGTFETRIPVYAVGNYSLRVKDPVTGKVDEQRFEVTGISAEQREATRNEKLQRELAEATGGRSYDLTTVSRLPAEIQLSPVIERQSRHVSLWTTPGWFIAVIGLMLSEWLIRKLIHLP